MKNALISLIKEESTKHDGIEWVIYNRASESALNMIERGVQEIPAADVVEVVHARWINPHWIGSTSAANCSACNFEAQHREYRGVEKFYKYCPGCNAKMDLEESK